MWQAVTPIVRPFGYMSKTLAINDDSHGVSAFCQLCLMYAIRIGQNNVEIILFYIFKMYVLKPSKSRFS